MAAPAFCCVDSFDEYHSPANTSPYGLHRINTPEKAPLLHVERRFFYM